jgi:hypothetical protein
VKRIGGGPCPLTNLISERIKDQSGGRRLTLSFMKPFSVFLFQGRHQGFARSAYAPS